MPDLSPLSQTLTRDGKSVDIQIAKNDQNGWTLKTIDQYNNSITWEDNFPTDQAALDEAIACADEEGMDCLIGPDPSLFS